MQLSKSGKILINEEEQTTASSIYALGDCAQGQYYHFLHFLLIYLDCSHAGVPELTPVAIRSGVLLARRLAHVSNVKMNYKTIPTTVFTPIEYGTIGLSEEEGE